MNMEKRKRRDGQQEFKGGEEDLPSIPKTEAA